MPSGVGLQDFFNPVEEFTDFHVDPGIVGEGTPLPPRHQSMDLSKTHQGAAGVSLPNRGEAWAAAAAPPFTCWELTLQASLPPSRYPAHIILRVIMPG